MNQYGMDDTQRSNYLQLLQNPWKYAFFGLSGLFIILLIVVGINSQKNNFVPPKVEQAQLTTPTIPSPTIASLLITATPSQIFPPTSTYQYQKTCQTNHDCLENRTSYPYDFCFEGICRPYNYCRTDADCQIGGACQSPCFGIECNNVPQDRICGVRTKLNYEQNQSDDSRGCMGDPCRTPLSVKCINNACIGK